MRSNITTAATPTAATWIATLSARRRHGRPAGGGASGNSSPSVRRTRPASGCWSGVTSPCGVSPVRLVSGIIAQRLSPRRRGTRDPAAGIIRGMTTDADPAIVARLRAAGCVFAEDEARLLVASAGTPAELDAMGARRAGGPPAEAVPRRAAPPAERDAMVARGLAGLPLEHVLGWADFLGLRIAVDPGVFVPRRRTEFLVHEAVSLAGQGSLAGPGSGQ